MPSRRGRVAQRCALSNAGGAAGEDDAGRLAAGEIAAGVLKRTISQYTCCSRTRRAMSWLYCEPKSRMAIQSCVFIRQKFPLKKRTVATSCTLRQDETSVGRRSHMRVMGVGFGGADAGRAAAGPAAPAPPCCPPRDRGITVGPDRLLLHVDTMDWRPTESAWLSGLPRSGSAQSRPLRQADV